MADKQKLNEIKNKAEHELETIEMHGVINPATAMAKADAQTKIVCAEYLLRNNQKVR